MHTEIIEHCWNCTFRLLVRMPIARYSRDGQNLWSYSLNKEGYIKNTEEYSVTIQEVST